MSSAAGSFVAAMLYYTNAERPWDLGLIALSGLAAIGLGVRAIRMRHRAGRQRQA
jgi:hypothetical protein